MESKLIEYIIKISEEQNITHAAEKLFITPSALNQQLIKLEKELGTQLFYRSRTECHPTAAGDIYIKNAQEMLRIKRRTYNTINDIADTKKGHISVGFTPGRGITMFTSIYSEFHRTYPNVTVEPMELSVKKQQALISQGALDIGFMTLSEKDMTSDKYQIIMEEEILLAIPKEHPLGKLASPQGEPYNTLNIALLKYEPFVLMYKESTIRCLIDQMFRQAQFTPNVLFETTNNTAITMMIKSNLCCGIVPHYYIKKDPDGMACFSLPSRPTWNIAASYRKDHYMSNAAKELIRLAAEFWTK